jgi:hypothetical protein
VAIEEQGRPGSYGAAFFLNGFSASVHMLHDERQWFILEVQINRLAAMSIEEVEQAGKESEAGESASPPGNVLSFAGGAAKRSNAELRELLHVYDQLIALLRETDNDSLDALTDSILLSVVRCRQALVDGCDEETVLRMVRELRAGLHETPRTLRSLLPGLGPRLGESLEHKLGIQFAKY